MKGMTEHSHTHDYLPAAGRDAYLPFYDLLTKALGAGKIHRKLIDQARPQPGQRVLEIGCGTGNLTVRMARARPGVEVIGTDPDPLALARAEKKGSAARFERAYAQELPYPDASFDRVLSALMLHHLDEDTKAATLAEVARVLRPGGTFHLADFTGEIHGMHGLLARRMQKQGHIADGIPDLLSAAGLKDAEVSVEQTRIMGGVAYYRATRPE